MSKYLTIEEQENIRPALLLIDNNKSKKNFLFDLLVNYLSKKIDLFVLSQKEVPTGIKKLSPLGVHFLDKVREDIPYSIVILEDEAQKKQTLVVLEKLHSAGGKIILLTPKRSSYLFIDVFIEIKHMSRVSVFLVGDMFGIKAPGTFLTHTIRDAISKRKIELSGTQLTRVFPISDDDFITSIEHVLFSSGETARFYNVFYTTPETFLSLTHLLKRHEPELSVNFTHEKTSSASITEDQEKEISNRVGVTLVHIKNLKGFEKSISEMEEHKTTTHVAPSKSKIYKAHPKNVKSKAVYILQVVILGFLLYFGVTVVLFVLSAALLKESYKVFLKGDLTSAAGMIKTSNFVYQNSGFTQAVLMSLPNIAVLKPLHQGLIAYGELQEEATPVVSLLERFKSSDKLTKSEVSELGAILTELYFLAQRYDIFNLKNISSTQNFKDVSSVLSLIPTVEKLGGFDGERKYVVLFQNNNELRPTGGFIGSVAYVTVHNGTIKSTLINDVYDLDGQLKGHIEPHYIIRRYLQPNLYLRDSNFNPDFEVSASMSALLYNLESGRQVDGVIAIDTQVLKKLLDITGPLEVPGYDKPLTSDTVVGLLQNSIEKDFFPGSIQKKSVLSTIASKIIVTLETDRSKQIAFLKVLPTLLSQKHILFSFPSKSIQKSFVDVGFAGSLFDTRIQENQLRDFLSVNEANIGVNKVNEHITRKVTYSAVLKGSDMLSDASLTLKNTGSQDYRAYVRFILPENANLMQVVINGAVQDTVAAVTNPVLFERQAFVAPKALEVDQTIENGHKHIGFIAAVSKNQEKRIHLLYKITYTLPVKDAFSYSLLYVKQPGTLPYPLMVQLETGDSYRINENESSPIIFDGTISSDKEFKKEIIRVKE